MDQETRRKVQLVELEILKEVKRICLENQISFWLDSGSLLGAVRHQGFIPWDDDMDIGMLREDYERFLRIAPNALNPKYQLAEWKQTPENHYYPFAKVRKVGTIYQESRNTQGSENGFYIDIFPYDVFPLAEKEQKKAKNKIDFYKKVIAVKHGDKPWKHLDHTNIKQFLIYLPIRAAACFVTEKAKDRFDTIQQKHNPDKEFTHYYPAGATRYGRWVIKRNCLEELELLPFEDELMPCPKDYDTYLTDAYGDYMQFPPVEKRELGHMIVKIDFGDEAEKGD